MELEKDSIEFEIDAIGAHESLYLEGKFDIVMIQV